MLDTSFNLQSLWGITSTDVYSGGSYGAVLRYNGLAWTTLSKDELHFAYGIWGFSDSDIFVTGRNATSGRLIKHYDGKTWSVMLKDSSGGIFRGVWGHAPDNVYTVGYPGASDRQTIFHYNGISWTVDNENDYYLNDIWGSSPTDVYAVGYDGIILNFNGSSWSEFPAPFTYEYTDIDGTAFNNIYAVGTSGTILHFDGFSWIVQPSGTTNRLNSFCTGIFHVPF